MNLFQHAQGHPEQKPPADDPDETEKQRFVDPPGKARNEKGQEDHLQDAVAEYDLRSGPEAPF